MTVSRATLVTAPASEPITLAEARKQLELATDDTTHSDHLTLLIQAAREQWESDTDSCSLTQTWSVTLPCFYGTDETQSERPYYNIYGDSYICLPKRPIQSITSITYYDMSNVSQTLSPTVYSFDAAARKVHINAFQIWPMTYWRFDAITITFVAGYTSAALVPAIHKQAMRLLISHYFENRDMIMAEALQTMPAYEALVRRFLRSSYP